MMKTINIIILTFFIPLSTFANEIEVIELHNSKSLDQLVIEKSQVNEDVNLEEDSEIISDEISTEENEDEINGNEELITDSNKIESNNLDEEEFWKTTSIENLEYYFKNIKNINSLFLNNEFLDLLTEIDLDYSIEENKIKFFMIINYLYLNGEISKAYNLIQQIDFDDNLNKNFYKKIEIDYLLSTYQLETVCNLRNELNEEKIFEFNFLEKIDIFCLVLNDKLLEAELQNSILLETEGNLDNIFQELYFYIINREAKFDVNALNFENNNYLLYLYAAMMRIAELPLNENFLNLDPKNLSIAIILNSSTPINIRIKAANRSFMNNTLSVDSLSALYQSVDFDSNQLNNPEVTLETLKQNVELSIAYYYQLINIQIFPTDRLNALINFWSFARQNNLEDIAYAISNNIVQSFEIANDNAKYGNEIAISNIYNKNFEKATQWISLYEKAFGEDESSVYSKILLDLYSSNNSDEVIEVISSNINKLIQSKDIKTKELMFVIFSSLSPLKELELVNLDNNIYDDRPMPSLTIVNNINVNIKNKSNIKFLLFSMISINDKKWYDLHPLHLQYILEGFRAFDDPEIIKNLILEIFKDYKIL